MKLISYILLSLPFVWGCGKFLETKPASSLATITELADLQALLDNERLNDGYPDAGDIASDYYFLSDEDWNTRPIEYQVNYIWGGEIPPHINTWSNAYEKIFYANTIIDHVNEVPMGNLHEVDRRRIKGEAHFIRGLNFYFLSQLFAPALDVSNEQQMLGIPLRLTPDFNVPTKRSSMMEMYDQIIYDLSVAAQFLPETPVVKTKPSKASSYGALMRVFLAMENYQQAGLYADSCLAIFPDLIDFNELDTVQTGLFPPLNEEVIYHIKHLGTSGMLANSRMQVAPELHDLYDAWDLRKYIFYKSDNRGTLRFYGDYSKYDGSVFSGIATDEIYITRAECRARNGNIEGALNDMNYLLKHRLKADEFKPMQTDDPELLLKTVVQERYKELAFRGNIRWPDLRRLNKDPRFAKSLIRHLNGKEYILPPNHPRYVFKIPLDVIELTGIAQNQ